MHHKGSNIEMTRRLMACLQGTDWLNDEVINIYVGLLQVRTPLVYVQCPEMASAQSPLTHPPTRRRVPSMFPADADYSEPTYEDMWCMLSTDSCSSGMTQCSLPAAACSLHNPLLPDQDRDAERRKEGQGPKCHFYNSFFLNKLYKDAHDYNYGNVRRWTMPKKLRSQNQVRAMWGRLRLP